MSLQTQYDNLEPSDLRNSDYECPECESDNCSYDGYSFECFDCGYFWEDDFEEILNIQEGY